MIDIIGIGGLIIIAAVVVAVIIVVVIACYNHKCGVFARGQSRPDAV